MPPLVEYCQPPSADQQEVGEQHESQWNVGVVLQHVYVHGTATPRSFRPTFSNLPPDTQAKWSLVNVDSVEFVVQAEQHHEGAEARNDVQVAAKNLRWKCSDREIMEPDIRRVIEMAAMGWEPQEEGSVEVQDEPSSFDPEANGSKDEPVLSPTFHDLSLLDKSCSEYFFILQITLHIPSGTSPQIIEKTLEDTLWPSSGYLTARLSKKDSVYQLELLLAPYLALTWSPRVPASLTAFEDQVSFYDRRQRRLKLLEDGGNQLEIFIHESLVGMVIGKQGENLSRVARAHKVGIRVFPDEDGVRRLRLYGNEQSRLERARSEVDYIYVDIPLPPEQAPALCQWIKEESTRSIKDIVKGLHSIWTRDNHLIVCGVRHTVSDCLERLSRAYTAMNAPESAVLLPIATPPRHDMAYAERSPYGSGGSTAVPNSSSTTGHGHRRGYGGGGNGKKHHHQHLQQQQHPHPADRYGLPPELQTAAFHHPPHHVHPQHPLLVNYYPPHTQHVHPH